MKHAYVYFVLLCMFRCFSYLSAPSDCELLEGLDIINQNVHQSELVTEPNQHVQPRRMKGDTECFFLEFFGQVQWTENRVVLCYYIKGIWSVEGKFQTHSACVTNSLYYYATSHTMHLLTVEHGKAIRKRLGSWRPVAGVIMQQGKWGFWEAR